MRTIVNWMTLIAFTFSTIGCATTRDISPRSRKAEHDLPLHRDVKVVSFTSPLHGTVHWSGTAYATEDSVFFEEPGREFRLARSEVTSIRVARVQSRVTVTLIVVATLVIFGLKFWESFDPLARS